jgi:hypothetical protein
VIQPSPPIKDLFCDNQPLNLARAFINLVDFCISHQFYDRAAIEVRQKLVTIHAVANSFTKGILIQAEDPALAADFYVVCLGYQITKATPDFVSLHGNDINLFIDRGPTLGPVLELKVPDIDEAKSSLLARGAVVIRWDENGPRKYLQDPQGLIYNLSN